MRTLFFILFSFYSALSAQYVSTFYSSASFQIDDAMVQDKHGNLYGSHYMGSRVYKITPNGTASIFSSGYNTPNGLAFNSRDELYIVDNIGNRIYKVDTAGNRIDTIVVGNPSGIIKSIDSDTMIITQYTGHRVRKLAPDGTVLPPMFAGYPLSGPVGLCYGADSTLYVGNFTDRKIFKVDSGRLIYIARVPGFSSTSLGFITHANGFLYGTAFQSHQIYKIDPNFQDSVILLSGSTVGNNNGPVSSARFNGPNGILASRGGDSLFISDFNTGDIRLISGLLTNIEDRSFQDAIQFYPNPVEEILYIQLNQEKRINFYIYDQLGKIVREGSFTSKGSQQISLDGLPSSMYFLEWRSGEERVIKKLIKK